MKNDLSTLNKFIADAGVCSRRKAAELIKDGEIEVNKKVVDDPSYRVKPNDKVKYQDRYLKPAEHKIYLVMNKPKGYVTTVSDDQGRKTVLDLVKQYTRKSRIYPVGRLDKDTTGVLILTNDGDFAQKLANPKNEIEKVYQAILKEPLLEKDFLKLKKGIRLKDGFIKPDKIFFLGKSQKKLSIQLHSGKNRIIKRMFEYFGHTVDKLERVSFAGIKVSKLPVGEIRILKPSEIKI